MVLVKLLVGLFATIILAGLLNTWFAIYVQGEYYAGAGFMQAAFVGTIPILLLVAYGYGIHKLVTFKGR